MVKKTYSILLNITVEEEKNSSGDRIVRKYYFKGWKNANFKRELFEMKDPIVQSKVSSLQKIGDTFFKAVQKMATGR